MPTPWRLAAVLAVEPGYADIGFADGARGTIALDDLEWARKARDKGRLGPEVAAAHQVLSPGDVVPVEPLEGRKAAYALRQIPAVSGALVALDPHTGRVLALVGGFDFATSEFDRATQARRQPGSAFKPFVYLAALDSGYTPASIVLDAPVVIDQGEHLRKWKPENYTERFYGPSTLRVGLEESRNLMTLRVAQDIGMKTVADYAARFGLHPDLPELPSAALGALETTPLDLAAAYAMLVNGGRRIEPAIIERIQDRNGRTVYRRDARDCDGCRPAAWQHQLPPALRDQRPVIADPRTTYQVVSMLEGAVQRGTGRALEQAGRADRRQDRAPPTSSATPGSWASPRTWWPRPMSGSTSRNRWGGRNREAGSRRRSCGTSSPRPWQKGRPFPSACRPASASCGWSVKAAPCPAPPATT